MPRIGQPGEAGSLPHASPLVVSGGQAAFRAAPPQSGRVNLAAALYPEIAQWDGVLDRLQVPQAASIHAAIRARVNGVTFQRELLFSGVVHEAAFFRALAEELGIEFARSIDPDRLILRDSQGFALLRRQAGAPPLMLATREGATRVVLATDRLDILEMRRRLAGNAEMAGRMIVVAPSVLRAALMTRMQSRLAKHAVSGLADQHPDYSAHRVVNAWQGFMVGFGGAMLAAGFLIAPSLTLLWLHGFFTLFFFGCVALRVITMTTASPLAKSRVLPFAARDLPVYSVLIALYEEAEVVPELLVALGRLQWPRAKLEIKLICEAGDRETIAAIRAQPLRPSIEIIEVPPVGPRTKPKALAYALPCTSGDFVALYDAEDKPHPLQLLEAWQRFEHSAPDVACVQAPLEVTNAGAGAIARLFAFEYAALFRGILPWLSRAGLLLPLGGTSNHFRRSALEEVVSWDSYNVTEDADLAVRLARFGYRTESIGFPTREEGPQDFRVWLPQRTRWFKGWLLTWFVHMRNPLRLFRQLGVRSFLVFQILFAGMVVSAIAHPLLLGTGAWIAVKLALRIPLGAHQDALFMIDAANIACGYASFLLLGWQTLEQRERKGFWKTVFMTPIYWALMSLAALRAVAQLVRKPHMWEKTPHRRMSSKDAAW